AKNKLDMDRNPQGETDKLSARVKQWKRKLSLFFPDIMVPTDFVVMENFPLTASGKIDWQALPIPDASLREEASEQVRAITPEEKLITNIWEEALGIKHLRITDNFFEIGGHSLIAIQ